MGHSAITFTDLLNRIRLIGGHVVPHPPAPAGELWLFGKEAAPIPWARGPMYPIRDRAGNTPIPGPMVENILRKLHLSDQDQAAFWMIQTHAPQDPKQNSK
jgi:hypothetical protein